MNSLQLSQQGSNLVTRDSEGNKTLSLYIGELKQEVVVKSLAKIKAAFPALPPEFYTVFLERMKDKGFSDERLIAAVNNVIDTCPYPTPALANFLSFDKRVKLLSYDDVCNIVLKHEAKFDNFCRITINEKPFYIRNADKELYNIPTSL